MSEQPDERGCVWSKTYPDDPSPGLVNWHSPQCTITSESIGVLPPFLIVELEHWTFCPYCGGKVRIKEKGR